ncbi:RNMT-activating mini protein [Cephus cinctus]|uniref:RNMT-activating mini protein n=1 Tax=Cephus cinctus TaxID=211228 RepID=A0AAJ7W5D4_CEPCN|nr:RNMT-activating mini protein [Cephus cinctus]
MPDPSLTEEQKNFIAECEAEFQDRFTKNDEAFMKIHTSESSKPPIMDPWYNKPRRNFDWSRQNQNQNRRNNHWERRHGDRSERIERHAGRQHLYSNRNNPY